MQNKDMLKILLYLNSNGMQRVKHTHTRLMMIDVEAFKWNDAPASRSMQLSEGYTKAFTRHSKLKISATES